MFLSSSGIYTKVLFVFLGITSRYFERRRQACGAVFPHQLLSRIDLCGGCGLEWLSIAGYYIPRQLHIDRIIRTCDVHVCIHVHVQSASKKTFHTIRNKRCINGSVVQKQWLCEGVKRSAAAFLASKRSGTISHKNARDTAL